MPAPRNTPFAPPRTFTEPVYLVLRDFGKLGFQAVADPEATLSSVIHEIVTGEIDRVVSVTEIHEGRASDITDQVRDLVHETLKRAA